MTDPLPELEGPLPWKGLGRAVEDARPLLEAWPVVTTLFLLSAATGVESYFSLNGLDALHELSIEEFTVDAAFGIMMAVLLPLSAIVTSVTMDLVRYYVSRRRDGQLIDRTFIEPSNLIFFLSFMVTTMSLYSHFNGAVALKGISINVTLASLWITIPSTMALVLRVTKLPALLSRALLLFALGAVPGVATFIVHDVTSDEPAVEVRTAEGQIVCPPRANLFWNGDRTLILHCGPSHQVVEISHPNNVTIRRL